MLAGRAIHWFVYKECQKGHSELLSTIDSYHNPLYNLNNCFLVVALGWDPYSQCTNPGVDHYLRRGQPGIRVKVGSSFPQIIGR